MKPSRRAKQSLIRAFLNSNAYELGMIWNMPSPPKQTWGMTLKPVVPYQPE